MYAIEISYSWGDSEPLYGEFHTEEQAFAKACELAGTEMYVANEEFDEDKTITVYVDGFNKRIDLQYDADQTWCYYRVVEKKGAGYDN